MPRSSSAVRSTTTYNRSLSIGTSAEANSSGVRIPSAAQDCSSSVGLPPVAAVRGTNGEQRRDTFMG